MRRALRRPWRALAGFLAGFLGLAPALRAPASAAGRPEVPERPFCC